MVRKGNQQKNSFDWKAANRRQTISDPTDVSLSEQKEKWKVHSKSTVDSEFYSGGTLCRSSSTSGEPTNETNCKGNGKRSKQRHCGVPCDEKSDLGSPKSAEGAKPSSSIRNASRDEILFEATETRSADGILSSNNHNRSCNMSNGLSMETVASHVRSSIAVACQRLRLVALDVFNAGNGWFEQQKPRLSTFKAYICNGRDYILVQIKDVYPIIWTWTLHLGQLIFLLCVIWLDCNIRGLSSLLHLGTTSLFTIIWCSILWIISMVGFTKALIFTVISAIVGAFVGLGFGILSLAIFGAVSLWLYGSFWTTTLVAFIGGSTFASGHERVALLVTTLYSTYCAKSCVGWLGLLLGLNLSFLSSEILTYFIRNNASEQESYSSAEDRQTPTGASYFYGEPSHSSSVDDASGSPSSGIPSTSGCDAELTSDGEVLRLLNCNDHYSAFGFTRFENIDVSLLKREYRKKAMLVHPDKNMGNEKAAEAFKKLQNAYEVLLDTLKRKTYDDELRREELLNYFLRFQNASRKNGKHSIFSSGSNHFEADDEGSHEESRRIACKKCGDFHKWTSTGRPKSQARWCQDCNDFHQAKDGDGWLEQSLHPFLFGLLHKVDPPCAFVCAEGRIYDATEWFICQGMRCLANTHKPSFHVNMTLSSKHNNNNNNNNSGKGPSSSSYRGGGPMPNANNLNETMTEEEFFELLQHAMQSAAFEASGGGGGGFGSGSGSGSTNESPASKSGVSSKGGSSSNVKKKRKGKKQW